MSFFGLTALGPQSIFESAARSNDKTLLHIFEEHDLKQAFDKLDRKKSGKINQNMLGEFLENLYHGPIPEYLNEEQLLRSAMKIKNDVITWDQVRLSQIRIREDVEKREKMKVGNIDHSVKRNFASHQEYRDYHQRHARGSLGPKDQLIEPLTAAQAYGWHSDELRDTSRKVYGKKTCFETKYASELVKSGIYY